MKKKFIVAFICSFYFLISFVCVQKSYAILPEIEMALKDEQWPQITDKPELAKKYAVQYIKENLALNPGSVQDIESTCFYDNRFFKAYVVIYEFTGTNAFGAHVKAKLQANVQIFRDPKNKMRYEIYNIIELK